MSVSQDVLEQAAATSGTKISTTSRPSYFALCEPRSYSAFDMEMCYDCCTFKCETGKEFPAVNGVPVRVCLSVCL